MTDSVATPVSLAWGLSSVLATALLLCCAWGQVAAQTHDETAVELSGFSVSQTYGVDDGHRLDVTDSIFQKLLYRVKKTSLGNLRKYSQYTEGVSWEQLIADPHAYRMRVFARRGKVRSVTKIRLSGVARDAPIVGVYRADCVSDSGQPFQVVTLTSPTAWRNAAALGEPIRFDGFFYAQVTSDAPGTVALERDSDGEGAIGETTGDREVGDHRVGAKGGERVGGGEGGDSIGGARLSVPLFIAPRLFWHPVDVRSEMGVTPSHVLLSQAGVDIGGLDLVRREQSKPLESVDAEMFFQFLAAVGRLPVELPVEALGVDELLRHPQDHFGRAVGFRARVKQCSLIRRGRFSAGPPVATDAEPSNQPETAGQPETGGDSDADSEFGHYYQLTVFPDLKSQVVVSHPDQEKEDLVYRRFPVTVCCRELPPGLSASEIENQQVWIGGFYYRFWKFRSLRTDAAGVPGQLSPLVMARQPILVESHAAMLDWLPSGILVGLLLGALILVWFFRGVGPRRGSARSSLPQRIENPLG